MNQRMKQHSIGIVINYNDLEQDMFKTEQNWSIWTPSSPDRFFHDIWHPTHFFFFLKETMSSQKDTQISLSLNANKCLLKKQLLPLFWFMTFTLKNVIHVDLCRFVQDGEGGGPQWCHLIHQCQFYDSTLVLSYDVSSKSWSLIIKESCMDTRLYAIYFHPIFSAHYLTL